MGRYIEHCHGRQRIDVTYRVNNWGNFDTLYIFKSNACKAENCQKRFYNYIWYDSDGKLHRPDPQDPNSFYVAKGKQNYQFDRLIDRQIAVEIPKWDPRQHRESRANAAGIGEWTRRAKSANSARYILNSLKLVRLPDSKDCIKPNSKMFKYRKVRNAK